MSTTANPTNSATPIIDLSGQLWKDSQPIEGTPTFIPTKCLNPRLAITIDGYIYDTHSVKNVDVNGLKFKSMIHYQIQEPGYGIIAITDTGSLCVFYYVNNVVRSVQIRTGSYRIISMNMDINRLCHTAYCDEKGWVVIKPISEMELTIESIKGKTPNIDDVIEVDELVKTRDYSYRLTLTPWNMFVKCPIGDNALIHVTRTCRIQAHVGKFNCSEYVTITKDQGGRVYVQIANRTGANEQLTEAIKGTKIVGFYRYEMIEESYPRQFNNDRVVVLGNGHSYYISDFGDTIRHSGIDYNILRSDN